VRPQQKSLMVRRNRKNIVIDTGVLTLFFTGDERVRPYFYQDKKNSHVTSVNLAEFYYKTCRTLGSDVAGVRYHQCQQLLEVIETSPELSIKAGMEKCRRRGTLSLADCYAIAATRTLKGTLLTTDSELDEIEDIDARFFKVY